MQVEELYDFTSWVIAEIVDRQILQKYQGLHRILQENTQPNRGKQPFEDQKNDLLKSLRAIPLSELSVGQLEILQTIGIASNVGEAGASRLEESLFRNAIDIATAANSVQKSIQDITVGSQWSQQIRELVEKIVNTEEVSEIGDEVLLRVHFSGDAHLANLTEFKDWGKTWWEIGRGIAMANGEAPEDIRVVGASKGSIIISLLTTLAIAQTTSGIIMEALKVAEKVLEIRRKAQEVRTLMIANDIAEASLSDAEKNLNEAAHKQKTVGVDEIVKKFKESLGINADSQGDKVQALDSSIKKLVDFIEKGGEVDFVLPDEGAESLGDDDKEKRDDLRVVFKEIRQLEKKMRQIEYNSDGKSGSAP